MDKHLEKKIMNMWRNWDQLRARNVFAQPLVARLEACKPVVKAMKAFDGGRAFASELCRRKGFVRIGSGAYGTVLHHPKSNKVLKVLHRPCGDGWPAYVKWATDAGYAGTFAPLVHSYKYVKKGQFAIASMEKLDNTMSHGSENSDAYAKYTLLSLTLGQKEPNQLMSTVQDLVEPGMSKFSADFTAQFGYASDLHGGNAMSRGDQVVITDPICSASESSLYGSMSWKATTVGSAPITTVAVAA